MFVVFVVGVCVGLWGDGFDFCYWYDGEEVDEEEE